MVSRLVQQIVIVIGGPHGTGKSTYAKVIAEKFSLKHLSAGEIFRQLAEEDGLSLHKFAMKAETDLSIDRRIDETVNKEAERGSVIIDGQLAAWMTRDKADLKIFLTAPDDIRFKRIADRDCLTIREAERLTRERETKERVRFKKIYGIDITDITVYHLIVDTSVLSLKENMKMLKNIVSDYIEK